MFGKRSRLKMAQLDWVQARSDCTLEAVFDALREAVQEDLKQHRKLNPERAVNLEYDQRAAKFHVRDASTGKVIMFVRRGGEIKAVEILHSGEDGVIVSGVPAINMHGECVFQCTGGATLHAWQFRMIALEDMFFGRAILNQNA